MSRRTTPVILAVILLASGGFAAYRYLRPHAPGHLPAAPAPVVTAPANAAPPDFHEELFAPISVLAQSERIPVIMYHDVIKTRGPGSVWFDCTVREFAAQMRWLKAQGAHPITLEALHRHLVRGDKVPEGAVVLTFDDNYQGFFDNAYPILKKYGYPSAMFVHTDYVGNTTGDHPHMSWETLLKLDAEGLVTIGSHTLSHPDDITKLAPDQQERELGDSKQILEAKLGHAVPYFAYPDGKNDGTTQQLALKVGYTMAFTVDNGPAEESPGILAIHRYINTRLEKAWDDAQRARQYAPAAVVLQDLSHDPVTCEVADYEGVKLGLVRGGTPQTIHAATRQSVGGFVHDANAVAGINGTFFLNALIRGTGVALIGPSQSGADGQFLPDLGADHLARLANRPFVFWGPSKIAIVPFQPGAMNDAAPLHALVPDFTDAFLAGAWLVHNGIARTREEMAFAAPADFNDPRKRAFFGVMPGGQVVLGATIDVVSTTRMAAAAAAAGVSEAVLLDSGFSTSLVFDNKIVVTGHTDVDMISRPVPHAIVLSGTLAQPSPTTVAFLQDCGPAWSPDIDPKLDPETPGGKRLMRAQTHRLARRHRRRRRRRIVVAPDSQAPAPVDSAPASAPPAPPDAAPSASPPAAPDSGGGTTN